MHFSLFFNSEKIHGNLEDLKRVNGGYNLAICESSQDRSAGGSVVHSIRYGGRLSVDER